MNKNEEWWPGTEFKVRKSAAVKRRLIHKHRIYSNIRIRIFEF